MKNVILKYSNLTKHILHLHPFQKQAIESLILKKSCLVIAPTGKGKSLIYQIAGQELSGTTLVISPLIALINEQSDILGEELALNLTSEVSFADQRQILREIGWGKLKPKFIFLSPERLQNYFFRAALKKSAMTISLVVIDEVHCISQWGFDFRPDYSQINSFLDFLKTQNQSPPILAMTATMGKEAKADIINEFSIDESNVFIDSNVLRNELVLNFIKVEEEREKVDKIVEIIENLNPKKCLIYFYNIPWCKKVCNTLNRNGYESNTYFSEMGSEEKDDAYHQFKNGEIKILCATTAFGMGMNIPDIDMVLHHQIPNSIEEYYQQVGRAARDKILCPKAICYLIWSQANFDFKFEEHIPNSIMSVDNIEIAFKKLGLYEKNNEPQSIEYSDYISKNLARFRFALERRGLMKTLGEVNGTPKTIEFFKKNDLWENIVTNMGFGDSFIRAATNSNMSIQELIDLIFEKELNGEIKKFPAMKKKIFFQSEYNSIPLDKVYEIVEESLKIADFKIKQVEMLSDLVDSEYPNDFIMEYFKN